MNEEEWLACENPDALLSSLRKKVSERQLRLLIAAVCRRVQHLLDGPEFLALIDAGERVADKMLSPSTLARYRTNCPSISAGDFTEEETRWAEHSVEFNGPVLAKRAVWLSGALDAKKAVASLHYAARAMRSRDTIHEEFSNQCNILREIFGNPFRPVTLDPSRLTSTVTALAQMMYDTREFTAMPILADALQDASCDNEAILTHCRGPGPHVRGCWAIDLLTGRE